MLDPTATIQAAGSLPSQPPWEGSTSLSRASGRSPHLTIAAEGGLLFSALPQQDLVPHLSPSPLPWEASTSR